MTGQAIRIRPHSKLGGLINSFVAPGSEARGVPPPRPSKGPHINIYTYIYAGPVFLFVLWLFASETTRKRKEKNAHLTKKRNLPSPPSPVIRYLFLFLHEMGDAPSHSVMQWYAASEYGGGPGQHSHARGRRKQPNSKPKSWQAGCLLRNWLVGWPGCFVVQLFQQVGCAT